MHDKLEIVNMPADKMTCSVDDRCRLEHVQQQSAGDTDMQLLSCIEELRYLTSNLEMSSSNGGGLIRVFVRDHAGKGAHEKMGPLFREDPFQAPPPGLEPRQRVPKTRVLPLHHGGTAL